LKIKGVLTAGENRPDGTWKNLAQAGVPPVPIILPGKQQKKPDNFARGFEDRK
jgi:hypothetical protein